MPNLPPTLLRWAAAEANHDSTVIGTPDGLALRSGVAAATITFAEQTAPAPFVEAVASWQGSAPAGTEIEVELRVLIDGYWTRWWTMGVWSAAQERRYSVDGQHDEDGNVTTDTLILAHPATALACRVTLRASVAGRTPTLRGVAAITTPAVRADAADPVVAVEALPVPPISQMEFEGGEVWCSPTSLTMVLRYWFEQRHDERLAPFAAPDAAVHLAVPNVYDPVYDGTGNWSFNTAYASSLGLEAYVARFHTLAEIAPWLAAGVPVITSISWESDKLHNAAVAHSDGHLLVVVGFTPDGDVIVNDPAALPSIDGPVRRVYRRDQFRTAWHRKGCGTVYLVYPADALATGATKAGDV